MNRWKKHFGIAAIIIASIAVGAVITYAVTRTSSNVPASVRSDLSFSPLVPTSDAIKTSDFKLGRAEDGTQTLAFTILADQVRIAVNQYAQPKQFIDVPEYKERFLSGVVNQTNTVQTSSGVIYIGRTDTDNRQIAVMIENGLLIFFNPASELPDETWRKIGDSLQVEKTVD